MSTSSSDPKGAPPGGRKKGDTVPALDARAAADEALRRADEKLGLGETLILPPSEVPGPGAPGLRGVDPDATARLPRRDLVSPHEGTVLMPTLTPPDPGPVQARRGEPDTQPGLPATELVPVKELLPEVFGSTPGPATPSEATVVLRAAAPEAGAHEGTMLMPVASAAAPESGAHEGTMLMPVPPVAAPGTGAHEGTMLMPVPPVAAPGAGAHEGTMLMPVPPAAAPEAGAHEGTMLMPVASAAAPGAGAHEGTMLMPVASPAAPEAGAHEGTMLMQTAAAPPEDTRPDLVPPPTPEGVRTGPPPPPDLPSEPTVLTAADIIRQTFTEEPQAEGRTIKVTQGNLPELRLPELPDLQERPADAAPAPPAAPAPVPGSAPMASGPGDGEGDPEVPRSTLHMPLKAMPEARLLPPGGEPVGPPAGAPTGIADPGRPSPESSQAPATAILPGSAARTAALGQPRGIAAGGAPTGDLPSGAQEADPPRGASGLLWFGIVLAILVVGGGLFVWKAGLLEGRMKAVGTPAPGLGKATPPAGTETDEEAAVPEPMRPAYAKALAGDPNAMQFIATCYMQGLYVNRDPQKGLKWYRRAAAAGSAAAQRDLQALEAQGIR